MEATNETGVQKRTGKDGVIAYYINYRDEFQKKKSIKVGTSKDKPKKMTAKRASLIRSEKVIEAKNKKEDLKTTTKTKKEFIVAEMTLDEVFEEYYMKTNSHLKNIIQRKANYYNKISPYIGEVLIKDLEEEHRIECFNELRALDKKHTLSSIEGYINMAQATINILIDRNLYKNKNPFSYKKGTKPKQANTRRDRALTIEEIDRLYEDMNNYTHYKNYDQYMLWLNISLTTGARVDTILNIKTEDLIFDGQKGKVKLRESKTETNVIGILNPDIVQELIEFKAKHQGKNTKIFKVEYMTLYRFFSKVFDKLFNTKLDKEDELYRYKKAVPSTLRHTFITRLIGLKVSLIHIQKLMGHKNIATTAGYVMSTEKDQENAVIELMNEMNYRIKDDEW